MTVVARYKSGDAVDVERPGINIPVAQLVTPNNVSRKVPSSTSAGGNGTVYSAYCGSPPVQGGILPSTIDSVLCIDRKGPM